MRIPLLLLLLALTLPGNELSWISDYDTAKKRAADESKIILLMFTQEGCPACRYMEENTFRDPNTIDYIHYHFIPVQIDIYEDTIPDGFRPLGTPTFYFTDASGKKVARKIFGGAKAEDFLKHLQSVRESYLKNRN